MRERTADVTRIEALIEPVIKDMELELYDVDLCTTRTNLVLRVVVDRPGGRTPGEGVSVKEIVSVNRELSAILDIEDPIAGRYRLDVESPGIERKLARPRHFHTAIGDLVHVVMTQPSDVPPVVDGELVAADESGITVRLEDGEEHTIAFSEIRRARTMYEWGKKSRG